MSTSYTLDIGKRVFIKGGDITGDGIIAFWPVYYDETPDSTGEIDNTSLNLWDNQGDLLLHISFRRVENAIVFNTDIVGRGWGREERVPLAGKIATPAYKTAIIVFDFVDRYHILIDYRTAHSYKKRISANVRSVSYRVNIGQRPMFGDRMQMVTYSSMELIMDQLYSSGSPISHSMYGYYTISPVTESYKVAEGNLSFANQEVFLSTGDVGRQEVKWEVAGASSWNGIAWIKNPASNWYIRSCEDPKSVTSGSRLITSQSSLDSRPIWRITKSNDTYIIRSEFGNLCWTLTQNQKIELQMVEPGNSAQLWLLKSFSG